MDDMKKTVLIAEDSEVTQKVLKFMLSKQGYYVVSQCMNGVEAVEQYKKLKPDVILMDIAMPEKDGITATKEIIAFDKDARIIVVSALYNPKMKEDAREAGARGYVIKPFEFNDLIRAMKDCLGPLNEDRSDLK
ncbi:MAG: response regulator [Thermoplasmata archaeon]|nr:response regulator [Thermoplasmata archaeon]